MSLSGDLPHPKRYITTHNEEGKAIIDSTLPDELPFYAVPSNTVNLSTCYVTEGFPTVLEDGKDIAVYQQHLADPPGLTVSNGTVIRYVDIRPGVGPVMHRTVSLDYGVVLEGEVELSLDSGDKRVLRRGDICIQRATMHAWRNASETEWARLLFVLQPVKAHEVAGKELTEDLGDLEGVRPST
ncbi:hypothetical protein QBC34DRAFT_443191 [Podospora aff. communis PSN243]|uniref:Cupin type-2 domain-containing protein n=1 Tax=Podospora aff. communis PSN243 TaxID=3040156 RepID=A0AAV9G8A4_9PEZI|nr:hypothetical protein QBC34DRAFT_443191 [Podospora aff. communis PSN243]